MGALTSSPPPPAAGGSGNTPPAPVRRVGEAAEPGALQRRGAGKSARMGARPPPVRQQAPSPPRLRLPWARADLDREEAARGTEEGRL